MIPKIIHYCWFGGNPLPKSAIKCIESWKKFFPDYEIKEWNEDNFDVNIVPYTRQAYEMKKYAFVSDYARFWILYHYGGIYFDTDVEVIKSFGDIIEKGAFMGCEMDGNEDDYPLVAPGLCLGVEKEDTIYKSILDYYSKRNYTEETMTVVGINTEVLKTFGLQKTEKIQRLGNITIYPQDFFNPLDDATGRLRITENTRSIHWFAKTWVDNYSPLRTKVTRLIHRYFGVNSMKWLKKILHV
ncbi:MAG: glycosyl transferase [Bacteroidales bacterium]|nr:glycosyl transferase [Bacteroidales bacterium]